MDTLLKKQYVPLVITIVLCLFGGVVFSAVIFKMKIKFEKTTELKQQLVSYEVNKKAFNDEADQINLLQKRSSALESSMVNSTTVPGLLSHLESLAELSGIKFEITSVQTVSENDSKRLSIACTTEGGYDQILNLFNSLQHQAFQVNIKNLNIFSEVETQSVVEAPGAGATNPKTPPLIKKIKWHGIATIEIISFQ